nr:hypothetical protein [Tanacetum cinerariifolium]
MTKVVSMSIVTWRGRLRCGGGDEMKVVMMLMVALMMGWCWRGRWHRRVAVEMKVMRVALFGEDDGGWWPELARIWLNIVSSPSDPNAPSKTPSIVSTSSSSIDSKLKSPTFSTSPSSNGYFTLTMYPPPRVPPPPPTQESRSINITLTLSPITPIDI